MREFEVMKGGVLKILVCVLYVWNDWIKAGQMLAFLGASIVLIWADDQHGENGVDGMISSYFWYNILLILIFRFAICEYLSGIYMSKQAQQTYLPLCLYSYYTKKRWYIYIYI